MANNTADIGFEKEIWDAACVLWGHIPAADYRKVIIGLIFLRYISSAFDKRYKELGGELITIGSDAHRPEDIGFAYDRTEALLKELGYKYYAVYKQRLPEMYNL